MTGYENSSHQLSDKASGISMIASNQIRPIHKKVIRDSFTMPSEDYDLIATIKEKCLQAHIGVTKSEILRAGLHMLNRISIEELKHQFHSLEKVKTGRPK
ncbi:MAG: hypothetical protein GY774_01640 [Planctomycetes bacterium]|nr:hypothetical protein [Planctomycetota bacterium]